MRKKSGNSGLTEQFQKGGAPYCKSSVDIRRENYIRQIAGENDKNFTAIKQVTAQEIFFVPAKGKIDIYAPDQKTADAAAEIIRNLKHLLQHGQKGKALNDAEIQSAIRKVLPPVAEKMSLSKTYPVTPRNDRQKQYLDTIASSKIVFGIGPAGTGKTYLAVAMAYRALANDKVKKIILTRPVVEAGEKMGFLPGDFMAKIDPYMRPLYDSLEEFITKARLKKEIEDGRIEIVPFAYMRGRTLKDAFIILDEAQNTTPEQMKMFLTRMQNSTVVVNGDKTQCDLSPDRETRQVRSGLNDALEVLSDIFPVVAFDRKDIVRDPDVARVVEAYEARAAKKTGHPQPSPG